MSLSSSVASEGQLLFLTKDPEPNPQKFTPDVNITAFGDPWNSIQNILN